MTPWSIKLDRDGRFRPRLYSTGQISPRGVLSTTKMGGLDREVTPPRGVLNSTEIVNFDRDFTPQGEICHLKSPTGQVLAMLAMADDKFQISDFSFAIPQGLPLHGEDHIVIDSAIWSYSKPPPGKTKISRPRWR